jgi:hypothetical protein
MPPHRQCVNVSGQQTRATIPLLSNHMTKVEIPLSKVKILLLLIGSEAFVIGGILFIITPDTFISTIFRSRDLIRLAGIAGVILFGAAGIYGARKLFDKSVGLIIDDNGITDNTNASSAGLIYWKDITEIKTKQVMSTKYLLIFVSNPDNYLGRVSGFKRKLMTGSMKMYGTPLSITANTLKYNFKDLEKLILDRLKEQQESMP